jgi:DNA-binding NarL/FixJ family response regulator
MLSVMVHALNPIMQAGLESIIHSHPDLQVVGNSSHSVSLWKRVEEVQPDIILLEWSLADSEPIWETLHARGTRLNRPTFVVLADYQDSDWATDVLNKGVRGILPRNAASDEILAAIVAASTGLVVLPIDLVEDLLPRSLSSTAALPTSPIQSLTPRETEVLEMLALGMGNKTIAVRLGISEHTVKFHISSIFTKLNVSSRTEAVTLGVRLGWIML